MSTRIDWETLSPTEKKIYWEGLHANPAWVSLCQAVQAQADDLQKAIIFTPTVSVEDSYRTEGMKGELRGKLSVSATAEAMYQEACVEVNEAQANQAED